MGSEKIMHLKIQDLQNELDANNISDFQLYSFDNFTLKIVGSFDFAYYHNVEITFYGVSYVSCATDFSNATIRLATDQDRKDLLLTRTRRFNYTPPVYKGPENYIGEKIDNIIICIPISENLDKENCVKYFIVARDFDYKFEDVLYYDKED